MYHALRKAIISRFELERKYLKSSYIENKVKYKKEQSDLVNDIYIYIYKKEIKKIILKLISQSDNS